MFERFTGEAKEIMTSANQEAQRMNHEYIGTEHILLGLTKEGSGVGATILKSMGLNLKKVRSEVKKLVPPGPDMVITGKLPQTPRAKKVIEYALGSCQSFNKTQIDTGDLLIGLLCEGEGIACQILNDCGVNLKDIQMKVKSLSVIQKKKKKENIKKVATKKKQRPVKCKIFELNEEEIIEFLKTKEFVQATQSFLIMPSGYHTQITIFYRDKE